MKKKTYVVGVAVLLAALLAMAGVAQSAMWVGAELGGNFIGSSNTYLNGRDIGSSSFNPSVIGGATIGYDFVNAGFGAYAWPDWMKYFSVATDITYNRFSVYSSGTTTTGIGSVLANGSRLEGYAFAWTFMLMAHYGFLPDSEIPTGRVVPYIGVGPAIVWSGIDAGSIGFGRGTGRFNSGAGYSTNLALVVEPGIRWVCFKNVSVDTAFRYRYVEPTWTISPWSQSVKNSLNMFSFLVRANYHF
jgi:hypothetical protein